MKRILCITIILALTCFELTGCSAQERARRKAEESMEEYREASRRVRELEERLDYLNSLLGE